MSASGTVVLIVAGARFCVRRDRAFELFDRNRKLLEEGRSETAQLVLAERGGGVLHLVLGVQQLALVEYRENREPCEADSARANGSPTAGLTAEDAFLDFDDCLS